MKRLLLMALISIGALNVYCQKYELSVSYSPFSIYGIGKMIDGKEPGQSKYNVLGAINVDYYRYMNDWLKLGVSVMYDRAHTEGVSSSFPYYGASQQIAYDYSSTKTAFVCSPQIEFEYLRHPKFKLSSGLAIGYAIEKYDSKTFIGWNDQVDGVTFHLDLISFRWGKKHGLTGNLGVGYKGALGLGYFVRF